MEELQKKFEKLLKENTELKHKIIDLQAEINDKDTRINFLETSIKNREGKCLKEEFRNTEDQENSVPPEDHTRMKELKEYLKQIRHYVTGLLGYKIEFEENEIRLHSLYAFNSEDIFVFRHNNGSIELICNDFAAEWKNEIDQYLVSGASIPGFLSAVTLELYSRKTYG